MEEVTLKEEEEGEAEKKEATEAISYTGKLSWERYQAMDPKPTEVIGDLIFDSLTSAQGVSFPPKVTGIVALNNLTSAQGLTLPERIGGNLYLDSLASAQGLTLPERIGGNLYLDSLASVQGFTFPEKLDGGLYLENLTSATRMTLPKEISGELDLSKLSSVSDIKFPEKIGGQLSLNSITSAAKIRFPQEIGAGLDLRNIQSLKGVRLPKKIGTEIDLRNVNSIKGVDFTDYSNNQIHLESITSTKNLNLAKDFTGHLYLEKVTKEEIIQLRKEYPNGYIHYSTPEETFDPSEVAGQVVHRGDLAFGEYQALDPKPDIVTGDLIFDGIRTKIKKLTLPKKVYGDIYLDNQKTLDGITFPEVIGGSLNLQKLYKSQTDNLIAALPFNYNKGITLGVYYKNTEEMEKIQRNFPDCDVHTLLLGPNTDYEEADKEKEKNAPAAS